MGWTSVFGGAVVRGVLFGRSGGILSGDIRPRHSKRTEICGSWRAVSRGENGVLFTREYFVIRAVGHAATGSKWLLDTASFLEKRAKCEANGSICVKPEQPQQRAFWKMGSNIRGRLSPPGQHGNAVSYPALSGTEPRPFDIFHIL